MSTSTALDRLAAGGMVLVADAESRENEADIVAGAATITTAQVAFIVRHTSGIICAPMPERRASALDLGLMVDGNQDPHATAFTVSVDHRAVGTGVSAADRARTLRGLAARETTADDLRRPGHVFPLIGHRDGLRGRGGHTEAAIALLRLVGCPEVGVIAECIGPDGGLVRGSAVAAFARRHDLPQTTVAEIDALARQRSPAVERVCETTLPTSFGTFRTAAFREPSTGTEHVALTMGDLVERSRDRDGLLVRVHSECLTGESFGSLRCDCGDQLRAALTAISSEGCGALVYLRGHEGRGIGLADKIRAYALQDDGLDTVEANRALGLQVDGRSYVAAVDILRTLGIQRLRLMTNNPAKQAALRAGGLTVTGRVALLAAAGGHNADYLATKQRRLGHLLELPLR